MIGLLLLAAAFAAGWGVREGRASDQQAAMEAEAAELVADGRQAEARADQLETDLGETQVQRDDLKRRLDEAEQANTDLEERSAALDQRESELDQRQTAIEETEAGIEANTVTDGVWTVGVDIAPGTYRATDVSDSCYWAILRTGTNGDDIVSNDLPSGGNPQVTVEEGHDFETVRCGEWVKVE
ncbi:hypothetical protein [Jiangella mangrovi]|uniref:Multidrug efflux pump subunit AcrA (Membrane-fusion protein) n=1 Tax=Jiangella mangrovi TaxID=1524084 RepID=A0A7W9GVY1_9ACTN|nr:hypothetical protein [Jiangella mangrovi]MBB5790741.1 multidrug efflux pump subunit AcrA (membrane-fusion protein) [Jiangella mangrovi]